MSARDGYEPGVPCWVQTVQPDAERAAAFYTELFGWKAVNLMPAESQAKYFLCTLRGRRVAAVVSVHGAPPPPTALWGTYVWVDDADAAAARAVETGGTVVGQPLDSPADARMAVLADPSGAVFCVWQPRSHRGAQLVNEPGAWAMSQLQTDDLGRAEAFYGSVFGWQREPFGPPEAGISLFRRPGYVGGEPGQPVPRDVIAAVSPLNGSGGPPNWGVDFWVSDADATAARAAALGGEILVAPHDTPGFRHAVIADPQGAVLSISQLVMPH